jgi:hypothetical protein
MTRSEFRTIAADVFAELLPKVKASEERSFISTLMAELEDQGLELDNDEADEDEFESDDDTYED